MMKFDKYVCNRVIEFFLWNNLKLSSWYKHTQVAHWIWFFCEILMSKTCCHEKWDGLTKQPYIFVQEDCLVQKPAARVFWKKASHSMLPAHVTSQHTTRSCLPYPSCISFVCFLRALGFWSLRFNSPFTTSAACLLQLVDLSSKFIRVMLVLWPSFANITCSPSLPHFPWATVEKM